MPSKVVSKKSSSSKTKAVQKKATKKVAKKTVKKSIKKVAKKSAAKKPVAKKTAKRTAKNNQAKVLVCAASDQCFWTTDGQVLQDMEELRDALKGMADEVFTHHVTKEKNDFADWVQFVLGDVDCADALRRSRKATTARTVIVRHLKYYE